MVTWRAPSVFYYAWIPEVNNALDVVEGLDPMTVRVFLQVDIVDTSPRSVALMPESLDLDAAPRETAPR